MYPVRGLKKCLKSPQAKGFIFFPRGNFSHHYTQAEGVANLDQVPEAGALVTIGFAKPEGGTGGYARYIAICPPSWSYGQSILESPGAPLPKQPYPLRRDQNNVLRSTPQ